MEQQFPEATAAECRRFDDAFGEEAVERLGAYLAWRRKYALNDGSSTEKKKKKHEGKYTDTKDWELAAELAMSRYVKLHNAHDDGENLQRNERRRSSEHAAKQLGQQSYRLPQLIFCHVDPRNESECLLDTTGHRVLHVLPAQINTRATSAATYADAFALYLESKFDRNSDETVTLFLDVRPGDGWPNPPALQIVGFIREVARRLYHCYPGRVHRCVIYPVPRPAMFIWDLIKGFLDPILAVLIRVIPGGAGRSSPPPNKRMKEYLGEEGLDLLEFTRLQNFRKEG